MGKELRTSIVRFRAKGPWHVFPWQGQHAFSISSGPVPCGFYLGCGLVVWAFCCGSPLWFLITVYQVIPTDVSVWTYVGVGILLAIILGWLGLRGAPRDQELWVDDAGIHHRRGTIPWHTIEAIVVDRFVFVSGEDAQRHDADARVFEGIVVVCTDERLAFVPQGRTAQSLAERLELLRTRQLGTPQDVPDALLDLVGRPTEEARAEGPLPEEGGA